MQAAGTGQYYTSAFTEIHTYLPFNRHSSSSNFLDEAAQQSKSQSTSEEATTVKKEAAAPATNGGDSLGMATATFAYTAEEEGELTFEKGDKVEILQKDESGWWEGILTRTRLCICPHTDCNAT